MDDEKMENKDSMKEQSPQDEVAGKTDDPKEKIAKKSSDKATKKGNEKQEVKETKSKAKSDTEKNKITDRKSSNGKNVIFKPQILLAVIAVLAVAVVVLAVLLMQQPPQDDRSIVATVNGDEVTKDQLFDSMFARGGQEALENLVTRKLIIQEAEKKGITVSEEEVDGEVRSIIDDSFQGSEEDFIAALEFYGLNIEDFREDAYLNLLVRKVAMDEIDLSEAAAREFYDENRALFEQREEVEARHILVESREEAEDIIALLDAGEEFESLAAEYSLDTSNKDSGGYLGFFGREMMIIEFEEAAFSLEIGDISEPIQTDFGFHIIEVLDRSEELEVEFEDVREDVMDMMLEMEMEAVINDLVQDLYDQSDIEYLI